MSLYKRNNHWWVRFTTPGGERVRRSTGTADKRQAQEFHDRLKTDIWNVQKLGERPKRIWEEAVIRWLKEKAHKATIAADKMHLRWLDQHLRGMELSFISRDLIDRLIKAKQAEGVSPATVNRMLQVLRALLRMAERDWGWIDKAPIIRLLPELKRRVRWLTRDEADRLISELPEHLAPMVRFSLVTGLRQRNVMELSWSQVDLGKRLAWIHPDQAKARKAIAVPLNAEAMLVLRKQEGLHPEHVFGYRGKPVRQVNTKAWKAALKRAGIENFRWHDLRHTWASWHVQAGTPQHILQELGGWESALMVRRYAHLSAEHLAPYAEKISRPRVVPGTNLAQGPDVRDVKEM
jgi:integrase